MSLRSHMSPLILPVMSGEEDRGVWSSSRTQKRNLQVDQEGGFQQRSNILQEKTGDFLGRDKSIQKGKGKVRQIHVSLPRTYSKKSCAENAKRRSARRADYSDIKMTKTRRRAGGDSGVPGGKHSKIKVPNPADVERS